MHIIISYSASTVRAFEIIGIYRKNSITSRPRPNSVFSPSKSYYFDRKNYLYSPRLSDGNQFAKKARTSTSKGNVVNYKNVILPSAVQNHDGINCEESKSQGSKVAKAITLYAPIWTTLAALVGFKYNHMVSPLLGSLTIMQSSLAFLMFVMGLTITPQDLSYALKQASVVSTNILYCFGVMPLISLMLSNLFGFNSSEAAGIILLGSVSGGQASNLFTLLAGGDVALSVVCTFSSTLLGVIATPVLIQLLLGSSIPINGVEVLQSITKLSLLPLMAGLSLSRFMPNIVSKMVPSCPPLGVLATLVLVAGGASNTAGSLAVTQFSSIAASCLLPLVGGAIALAFTSRSTMSEKSKRALVIEIISKSPTLAYVLARKHFDSQSAVIPAASMVSLAIIGALVASAWSSMKPLFKKD